MGMTIDKAIEEVQQQKLDYQEFWEEYKNEHIEALDMAIDTMCKYQQMQADYNARLKADMVAMLEDLKQDFIAEAYGIEMDCTDYVVNVADIDKVIQEKINSLKEGTDGENNN